MTLSSSIPFDIIEIIVEAIDDYPSLLQCAIVSRAFLTFGRKRLFRDIHLGYDDAGPPCTRLLKVLSDHPDLLRYIHKLYVGSSNVVSDEAFSPLLRYIADGNHLRKFEMNMYEDLAWHKLGFLLQDAFRSLFRSSSLHTLCFHGQIPPDVPIDLLASSCALKNLSVSHYHSSITYDVSDDAIRSLLPLRPDITAAAPQLESLEIMGKFASRLVKYLTHPLSPVQLSHLRELRVMKLEEENTTNTAWDVMQVAAKSLESLVWNDWSWHNSDPFKAVHLGTMQRLRFVELHGYTLRPRCQRLTNLLTSERMPTSIEKITLGFSTAWIHSRRLGIDEIEEIFMSSENQLDRTLAGLCDKAGFPCLRTVEVRVLLESVGESDTQARQLRLAKWFPALKETGYLSGGVFMTGE